MYRVLALALCLLGLTAASVAANAAQIDLDRQTSRPAASAVGADFAPVFKIAPQDATRARLLALLPQAGATVKSSAFPDLTGWVVDDDGMFTDGERRNLEDTLSVLSETTTHQVVLVTIPSLEGREISDYANQLGRLWQLGYRGAHNGVIILIAPNEHLVAFEVGDDLKAVLPETVTNAIIDNTITPQSNAGDAVAGIRQAVKYTALALERYARGFPVTSLAPLLQRRTEAALRACPQDAVDSYEHLAAPKVLVGSEFGCRWSDARLLTVEQMIEEALRLCQGEWGLECTVIKSSPELAVDTSSPPPIVSIVQCANTANPDIAIAACTAVLALEEETEATYADALASRGLAYYYKGDPRSAVADWDEAIRRLPMMMVQFDGDPRHVQAAEAVKSSVAAGAASPVAATLNPYEPFAIAVTDLNHRNYARAITELKRLALLGFNKAQAKLGMMYLEGNGVPRDPVAANWWLYLAAENGDAEAQTAIGKNLSTGYGVAKDLRAAAKWFRKASALAHWNATPLAEAAEARLDPSWLPLLPDVKVTIPELTAVGSNVGDYALRAIFSGDFAKHAADLAKLTAKSIRIPELYVDSTLTGLDGTLVPTHVIYRDIELLGIANGVARSASMRGMSTRIEGVSDITLGRISAGQFDLAGLIGLFSPPDGQPAGPAKTIYKNLVVAAAVYSTPTARCELGRFSTIEFKVRPIPGGLARLNVLARTMAAGSMSPDIALRTLKAEAENLDAVESAPGTWEGLDCSAYDPNGQLYTYGIGTVTVGAISHGRIPPVVFSDLRLRAPGMIGGFRADKLVLKSVDFSGLVRALMSLSDKEAALPWLQAHMRELVPVVQGVALSGVTIEGTDERAPGKWNTSSLASLDLTLGRFINGIPADVSASATHFKTNGAAGWLSDLGVPAQLLSKVGNVPLDLSAAVAAKWDAAAQAIKIDLSLNGVGLGSISASGDLGRATEDLFSGDVFVALATLHRLSFKGVRIDARDAGVMLLALRQAAANAGKELPEFRNTVSGWVQGAILLALGAAPQVQKLTTSVAAFIGGGKSLSVRVTAKEEDGIGLEVIQPLLEGVPTALSGELKIDAGSK